MSQSTRSRVDAAIERWLRALELAGAMRSTSSLLAQAADLGCVVHGSGKACSCPLTGIALASRAVALCSALERRVLALKYGTATQDEELAADGQTVVGRVAVYWMSDHEVARRMGLRAGQVERLLRSARRKVQRAIDE